MISLKGRMSDSKRTEMTRSDWLTLILLGLVLVGSLVWWFHR